MKLINNNQEYLYSCIKDLVMNGLDLSRFTKEEYTPTRQDVTQYIAKWFKYIGVSSEQCSEWLIDYSINTLSKISSSSISRIRHSTKSNIKYIYGSESTFECGSENNLFNISCDINCPIYDEMSTKFQQKKVAEERQSSLSKDHENHAVVHIEKTSIKDMYKVQFQKALKIANSCLEGGVTKHKIVNLLNDKSFKTRTGKKWTLPILRNELRKPGSNNVKAKPNIPH